MTAAALVASLGGIGRLRPAPGTWGSMVVLPLVLLGPVACLALALLASMAGIWAVHRVLVEDRRADPGWVVVDEAAGQLLALAALSAETTGWGVLLAFLLFRLFDIYKPGPVGWVDRRHGPLAVMLDDVVAGAMVAAILLLLRLVLPEVPI
ncbi:phosphatidylglycerophosphatase A [Belnapia sp. T6]|uniref:Phosphatidylglycerophosphatase A n=1 Tax=Belnapia mucosa TaxID=2804532 RepID=A0ABS1V2D4_9PROT|nr:phosphatidylglycerophosphatase A [Belnapia mucosa]MBL6454463.1 phosphatidylglycerophosphatase A [Belnapia mucosa]